MEQYIKKSALVAEIERRIKEVSQIEKASYEIGLCDAYKIVLRFLDTLEVKEVDLEKELKNLIGNVGQCDRKLARHFFELGLKAQKGARKIQFRNRK